MSKEINPNMLLLVGAGALLLTFGKGIKSLFSFGNDEADQAAQQQLQQLNNTNCFSPNYYKGKPGAILLYMADAIRISKIIYDAKGFFNDDEAAVYGAFQSLKTKTQVSFLAEVFFNKYKVGLWGFLQNMFNEKELAQVATIVNKLK